MALKKLLQWTLPIGLIALTALVLYFLEPTEWVVSPIGLLLGSGVIAAVTTQSMSWWKEHLRDREKTERDRQFIALQLAVALERYAIECAMRIDQISHAMNLFIETGDGPTSLPSLPPLDLPASTEWRWMSPDLSSEVLSLAPQISFGCGSVQYAYELADEHSGSQEAERQLRLIGHAAWKLARKLREKHNIPLQAYVLGKWDFVKELEQVPEPA